MLTLKDLISNFLNFFHQNINYFRSSDFKHLGASAAAVRNLGITTFAVGVGDAVASELRVSWNRL